MTRTLVSLSLLPLLLTACTGISSGPTSAPSPTPAQRIAIVTPVGSQTVPGPTVTLNLTVSGVMLVAADGRHDPQAGHLHVFVDRQPSPRGEPTPFEPGIIHTKETSIPLKDLKAGPHRIIVVLGFGDHVPFDPEVRAEVSFSTT